MLLLGYSVVFSFPSSPFILVAVTLIVHLGMINSTSGPKAGSPLAFTYSKFSIWSDNFGAKPDCVSLEDEYEV